MFARHLITALAVAVLLTGCFQKDKAQEAVDGALVAHATAMKAEKFDEALRAVTPLLGPGVDDALLFAAKAEAELAMGDLAAAKKTLAEGTKLQSGTKPTMQKGKARLRALSAEVKLLEGKANDAVDEAGRATSLAPDLAFVRARSGMAYIAKNKPEKALEYLDAAVRLGGENPDWYVLRGQAWSLGGETGTAAAEYKTALTKDAGHFEAALYLAASGVDDAPLKGLSGLGAFNTARRGFALGELDEAGLNAAAESYAWAGATAYTKAAAWRLIGMKSEARGELEAAVRSYQLCVASAPGGLDRYWCQGRMGRMGAP